MANTKIIENLLRETVEVLKEGGGGGGGTGDVKEETSQAILASVKDDNDTVIGLLKDAANGLSSIKSSASSAATDAAAAKTAILANTYLNSDINAGKAAIATAISNKGVTTLSTDPLTQMAFNIQQISQNRYTINGGEMYAKQLYGSIASDSPKYWNLYDVLIDVINRNSAGFAATVLGVDVVAHFGGILLCEFYKGYDTIDLSTLSAGSGGGFLLSDGTFYYNEEPIHTWNDDFDGKGNRWIAILFAEENHSFTISSAATCPRSIYIGGKVGLISYNGSSAGRISEIVVSDGNELNGLNLGTYTQKFGKKTILRNITHSTGVLLYNQTDIEQLYVKLKSFTGGSIYGVANGTNVSPNTIIVECSDCSNYPAIFSKVQDFYSSDFVTLYIKAKGTISLTSNVYTKFSELKTISIVVIDSLSVKYYIYNDKVVSGFKVFCAYDANSATSGYLELNGAIGWSQFTDLILQDNWRKTLDIRQCSSLTKQNVADHIFAKLGVNESGESVTLTLATAVYNLFDQSEIDAVEARTNINIAYA